MTKQMQGGQGGSGGAISPEQLSELLMRRRAGRKGKTADDGPSRTIPPRPAGLPVPASYAQQRLWLLDRLQPGTGAYNMPFPYRLRGPLDPAALEAALTDLARRHEALRTVFTEEDGQPLQRVLDDPRAGFDLAIHDVSDLAPTEREEEVERLVAAAAGGPFDLSEGPLWRVLLVRLGAEEHALLVNAHHIVFDGWSLGLFWKELRVLYAARRASRAGKNGREAAAELGPAPVQYPDFSVWQRERLAGDRLERHLGYWRQRLAGTLPTLDLPLDRQRPSQPRNRGDVAETMLSKELEQGLRRLARSGDASLFMVLLAGFKLLVARLAGQDDLLVGTPAAGRSIAELEDVIGFFVNTLVVRTDLSDDPPFSTLVARVRQAVLEATEHQDVPFEKLLEEIQPERHLSLSPLFQVFFNMVDLPEGRADLEGVEVTPADTTFHASKFDFTLYAESVRDGIHLQLVYDADLFERRRMEELLRQYEQLLAAVVEAPEAPVSAPSLVTPAARAVLPDPAAPLPDDWRGAVHEGLARVAGEAPDRIALVDRVGALGYGEMRRRTGVIARRLADAGLGAGDRVALIARRDALLPIALYGALEAGCVVSILDPAYPEARLSQLVERLAPRAAILAAEGPVPALPAGAATIVLPQRGSAAEAALFAAGADGGAPSPAPSVGPDSPALVTFTSGSTGEPKGVVGRHGPLSHFIPWMAERFGLGAGDRYSMLSGLSHDPLQRDIFTAGWLGGTLVIPDPDRIGEPGWPAEWAARERVTVAGLTPAMVQLLSRPPEDGGPEPFRLDSLRRTFVVGDVLTRGDVAGLAELAPAARCINLYGSTETQRAIGFHEVDPTAEGKEVLPLGRGMEGVQLLVLGDDGRQVGIGEIGEIHVRSHHLARGYLDDPGLTAERFPANPFADEGAAPSDRLYRTGDLGRVRTDGAVEMVGRRDGQVKIRGFRIETGEVASVLARHGAVGECTVVARDDLPGGRGLVAYWAPSGTEPAPMEPRRAFRELLAERLPDYMVPVAFVELEHLPLTATGKVDRNALPPVAREDLSGGRAGQADGALDGPVEELLGELWKELLGLDAVRSDDDFFALGGHSLLATRLLARIRSVLDLEVSLAALFEAPTVAGLARRIEALEKGSGSAALPPIERLDEERRQGRLPLSWAQERLWFLDRLEDGTSAAYNVTVGVRLTGGLDRQALEHALGDLVARHETLRCRFRVDADGHPYQVVAADERIGLPVEDLSGLADPEREAEVVRRGEALGSEPFDLAAGPLLRACLLRVVDAPEEHVLVLSMHHIATDGWSFGVVFRDLGAFYRARVADGTEPEALTIQYPDYAVWQREWLQGEVLDRQLGFWTELLDGAPKVLELPTDRPRPEQQSFRGARIHELLPPETVERLQALCRRAGATPFMVLITAWAVTLARSAGTDDLVLGVPVANRRHRELEELVGFFANTLALRVDLRPGARGMPTFLEALARVRKAAIGAFSHQELPFERLVDALDVDRDLSRSPLTQAAFAFQNAPGVGLELPGVAVREAQVGGTKAQLDLNLQMRDTEGGAIEGVLEYATDLFDRETAERFLERFRILLEGALEEPEQRVHRLPLLTEEERDAVLSAWNRTGHPMPEPATIHGLVRAQAVRSPEGPAVAGPDGELTYRELADGAARLGNHLAALGAGPERPVGVLMERTASMVVALLGVMEAGAPYLPLDPDYPAERLALMLEDAGTDLVVTQESLLGQVEQVGPIEAGGAGGVRPVVVDGADREAIAAGPADPPTPWGTEPPGDGIAYLIYTSGSTGRPKGVEVPHRAAANFLASMAVEPGLGPDDVVLSTTTVSFDISVLELFLPLSVGGRVVVVDRETAVDGTALASRLEGVTAMQATPTTWRLLFESGWEGKRDLRVLSGGEPLDRELADRLRGAVGEVWNVYGPTETTVWSSVDRVAEEAGAVPIGRPVANTTLHVVDPGLEIVPPGTIGELVIGGIGVTRGYRDRPRATAERFVPDPFTGIGSRGPAASEGARLYRTGDLARWRPDGRLECLGRTDHQVKVRGHRIEPGEIETALAEHPAIGRAVVVPRGRDPVRLVAYAVPAGERAGWAETPSVVELRDLLGEHLPDYMVPAAFVFLDELPTTPNGKVDRNALPEPEITRDGLGEEYVAPATDAEVALAAIWCDVLGLDRVGLGDNFFALGGDSILGIQVVTRAGRNGWNVAVRDLFRHQTLGALAGAATPMERGPEPVPEGRADGGRARAGGGAGDQEDGGIDTSEAGLSEDELDELLLEIDG